MIDMGSLLDEMDSMPSFDAPRGKSSATGSRTDANSSMSNKPSVRHTESSTLKQREKEEAAMKRSEERAVPVVSSKKSAKKRTPHSKYHGDAPVDLMTTFLSLVQSNQMQAALDFCPQILKFEPDNILIKMYQETMAEVLRTEAEAKSLGTFEESSSSEEEDDGDDDEDDDEDDDDGNQSSSDERDAGAEGSHPWPADAKVGSDYGADQKDSRKEAPAEKDSK
jgi:hypothetical protein